MSYFFDKMVFDKAIQVDSIVNMRFDQYTFPFVLEDNTQNCWTLYYVIQGCLDILTKPEPLKLESGDLLLLSADCRHSIRVFRKLPTHVFTMALELSGEGTDVLEKLKTPLSSSGFQMLNDIMEYADEIFHITVDSRQYRGSMDKNTTASVKQILQAKIELFLLELLDQQAGTGPSASTAPLLRSQIISRTNEELRRHLYDSVSIEEICASLNISKSYLSNIYKKKTGTSIIAHFNQMKIEEAKRLIASGTYNFTEISEKLGFSSIHYFSRLFKNITGTTPSAYEKSLKSEGGQPHE